MRPADRIVLTVEDRHRARVRGELVEGGHTTTTIVLEGEAETALLMAAAAALFEAGRVYCREVGIREG